MSTFATADRRTLAWAAAFGFTGVIFGAFGAHALKPHLTPEALLSYETAVRYQLLHALTLLVVVVLSHYVRSPWRRRAAHAFAWGIGLFSGSIYLLTLVGHTALPPALVFVTPIGGVCLMAGWLFLFLCAIEFKR